MGRASQRKGGRFEREIVPLHKDIGVHAERYPLSGASHFRGAGHDLDIYARGKERHARTAMDLCSCISGTGNMIFCF